MLRRYAEALGVLAVFLIPWQARWIYGYHLLNGERYEYGVFGVYAASIVAILAALMFLSRALYRPLAAMKDGSDILKSIRAYIRHPSRISPLWFVFVWFIISTRSAFDGALAQYYFVLSVVAFSYFVIARSGNLERLWSAYIVSGVVQALIAWQQLILQYVSPSTMLGVAEHKPEVLGQSVIIIYGQRFLRAYGLLPHPNILGSFLAIAFALAVYRFASRYSKAGIERETSRWAFDIFTILLLFSGVLISFSRSALIALVLLMVGWIVYTASHHFRERRAFVSIVVACAVLLIIFNAIADNAWGSRFNIVTHSDPQTVLEERSVDERILSLHESLVLLNNRTFLFGLGLGSYVPKLASVFPTLPVYAYQPVHNVFVLMVLEIGIVGVVLLAWFCAHELVHRWHASRHGFRRLYSFSIIAMMLGVAMVDHYLWTLYVGHAIWWFVFGSSMNRR